MKTGRLNFKFLFLRTRHGITMKKAIPLILDTDIGSDIDDTWALAMILKSPEIDLKMVNTNEGDTVYKAKLSAKMLQLVDREDVIVGIGEVGKDNCHSISDWVEDYDLSTYPNVRENAADAMIEYIMNSDEEVTILAIGSFKNLAEAYEKEPRITKKSRVVAIAGNVYNNAWSWHPPLTSEWNIRCDLGAWRRGIENSDWNVELVPLDVSGNIMLDTPYFEKVREYGKKDPLICAMVECTDIWIKNENWNYHGPTSPLFDTVGVYCVLTHDNIRYERLPIFANDKSVTYIDPMRGKEMDVAVQWIDKEKFYKFLVARLCDEI